MTENMQTPWWDRLSTAGISMDNLHLSDIEGDVIIANIETGSRNIATGKQITQTLYETIGEPTPNDKQIIQNGLAEVKSTLEESTPEIGKSTTQMAEGLLIQVEAELLKTDEDEMPNAAIITGIGDLLLNHVPQIDTALTNLFATPAAGRVVGKAGEDAVEWVKTRFGSPS
ncbi:hypothetical protein KFU94_43095 [Chloroflexi bacterium TSY]|nr:hypothetical protein [Chloroflexi bacterium TSY]